MQAQEQQLENILVGLDIGTTKICAVAARYITDKEIDILGVGKVDTEGVRKGVITNIDSAVKSIKTAIDECEKRCGFAINNAYVGVAGHHIVGMNMEGVVAVRSGVVEEQDIERVIDSARAFRSPDKELIHILSQEYIVDEQDGIKNPLGMTGKRLQAKVHIVLASTTSATNLIQACNQAGLNVSDIVLEPLASSLAVLYPEERQDNVIMIDIGGGTSDIVYFQRDSVIHTSVLPLGGNNLTRDISFGLRISNNEALRIKHTEGIASTSMLDDDDVFVINIPGRPERVIEKKVLATIIGERLSEIFELIRDDIAKVSRKDNFGTRIVLTGGTALLPGIQELTESILEMPVRIGKPLNVSGVKDFVDSPIFSTAVGLIRYGMENRGIAYSSDKDFERTQISFRRSIANFLKKFF